MALFLSPQPNAEPSHSPRAHDKKPFHFQLSIFNY